MYKIVVLLVLCIVSAMAASAQERGNLATPYRFRLPFLDGGEYVISAFGGTTVRTLNASGDSLTGETSREANDPWVDVNAVVALSSKFLIGAEVTVYPRREYVETHVAREFTVVYRPVERFEVFAFYFQDTPQSNYGYTKSEVDTKDLRAGVTYFGKF